MRGFYIEVTNNLLTPKHYKQMGEAVWLFMWITAPKLNWMNDVLEAWGFTYRTNLIWDLYLINSNKLKEYINSLDGFRRICISKKGWGNTWNLVLSWAELINNQVSEKLL